MYNIGGCIAKPKSCNNGFKSRPSTGATAKRSNGFDVSNMKSKKPTLTIPITLITRASISFGMLRLNIVTAPAHIDKVNAHNNNEPSCAPHTAETR